MHAAGRKFLHASRGGAENADPRALSSAAMAFAGENCSSYAAWSHRQIARLLATHTFDLVVADRQSAGSAEDLVRLVAAAQPGVPVVVMSVPWAAGSIDGDLAKPLSGPNVRGLVGRLRGESPRLFELPTAA